jgi:hypothetical protein
MPTNVVCGTPSLLGIVATITTHAAMTITYHWRMVDNRTVVTPDQTLTFSEAGTQTLHADPYYVDCGTNFIAYIVITAPTYWSAGIYYSITPSPSTPTPTPTLPPQASVTQVTTVINVPELVNCANGMSLESTGNITTDGPATVTYHWETGGSATSTSADTTLVFSSASTQPVVPEDFNVGCGDYFARLVVTSPNSMSAQANVSLSIPTVLPIYDFTTFHAIGTMACGDVANYDWDATACNGESGGCMISRVPLFGKSPAGFLRPDGNTICHMNLP